MDSYKFMGIYMGHLPEEQNDSFDTLDLQEDQYWYAWFSAKRRNYLVQPIETKKTTSHQPYTINPIQFNLNFNEEDIQLPEAPEVPAAEDVIDFNGDGQLQSDLTASESKDYSSKKIWDKQEGQNMSKSQLISGKEPAGKPLPRRKEIARSQKPPKSFEKPKAEDDDIFSDIPDELLGLSLSAEDIFAPPSSSIPSEAYYATAPRGLAASLDFEIRSEFRNAMELWEKGRKNLANNIFEKLLAPNDELISAHKHSFANFAVSLRKVRQNNMATRFALRCVELDPKDSHAYFNVGRLYYELKRYDDAIMYLSKAIAIEPGLLVAIRLLNRSKNVAKKTEKRFEVNI